MSDDIITTTNSEAMTHHTENPVAIEQEAERLTPEQRSQIEKLTSSTSLHDTVAISRYGEGIQVKSSQYAAQALQGVRTNDLDDQTADALASVVAELKGFKPSTEKKGLFGMLKKGAGQLEEMRAKFQTVEANLQNIVDMLERNRLILLKDINTFDARFAGNMEHYRELTVHILAGEEILANAEKELEELRARAKTSGLQVDAQAVSDYADQIDRFQKRMFDLKLTRTVCIQTAPQIRILQNADVLTSDSIQSTLVNAIPVFKNQIHMKLGIANVKKAIGTRKAVTDLTNQLMMETADELKMTSIEVAKENERGVVDVETLVYVTDKLIETFDETRAITQEGHKKRIDAERQIDGLEARIRDTLINQDRVANARDVTNDVPNDTGYTVL